MIRRRLEKRKEMAEKTGKDVYFGARPVRFTHLL